MLSGKLEKHTQTYTQTQTTSHLNMAKILSHEEKKTAIAAAVKEALMEGYCEGAVVERVSGSRGEGVIIEITEDPLFCKFTFAGVPTPFKVQWNGSYLMEYSAEQLILTGRYNYDHKAG